MNIFDTARNAWRAFTTDDLATMGGGSGPVTSADREIATVTYRVKTAFSGASVGDIVTSTRVLDVAGGTATQVGATIWYNESTAAALSGTPVAANLETAGGAPGLTDAQLRAAALPVSAAALPLPAGASTAALQGTANTSLANIDGKTPALSGGKVPVTDPTALPLPAGASTAALQGTANTSLANIDGKTPALAGGMVPVRDVLSKAWEPVAGSTQSLAVTTASSAAQAITAGEVIRFSNAGTNPIAVAFGTAGVVAVAATAMDVMPGTAESFTVPAGTTHFAAIMASGSGTLKWTRGTGV